MNRKAVIYGDSLMKGTVLDKAYRYRAVMAENLKRFAQRFNIVAENKSRFGSTSIKGLSLLKRDLAEGMNADYALLEFGGNDCNFRWNEISVNPDKRHEPLTKMDRFIATYRAMIEALRGANVTPILMTLPPIDAERYLDFLGRNGNNTSKILKWLGDVNMIYRYQESYSDAISQVAEDTKTPLVDVRGYFLNRRNYMDVMSIDGIHPNEEGHRLIYNAFEEFAEEFGIRNAEFGIA